MKTLLKVSISSCARASGMDDRTRPIGRRSTQPDSNNRAGSAPPGAPTARSSATSTGRTSSARDGEKDSGPPEASGRGPYFDTLVLSRRLDVGEELPEPLGTKWGTTRLRDPVTNRMEDWWMHTAHGEGWTLYLDPELTQIRIRLCVPKLMGGQAENYPLQPFDRDKLRPAFRRIASLIGWRVGQRLDPLDVMGLDHMGISLASLAIDVPLQDKAGTLQALRGQRRRHVEPASWSGDSILWQASEYELKAYDKAAELRAHLRRTQFDALVERHPELPRTMRYEVTLMTGALRTLFRPAIPPSWLPKLKLLLPSATRDWVVTHRLTSDLGLRVPLEHELVDDLAAGDAFLALLDDFMRANTTCEDPMRWNRVFALAAMSHALTRMSARDLRERYGIPPSSCRRFAAELRDFGVASPDSFDRRCLADLVAKAMKLMPRPVRPALSHEQLHGDTVDAAWRPQPDVGRDIGMVEDPTEIAALQKLFL